MAASIRKIHRLVIDPGSFPPSTQVTHFTPTQWEEFIEGCCRLHLGHGGPRSYATVKRIGGAGDAGRDVEARLQLALAADKWDLFQAKHYRSPLAPSEFFPELAKFFGHLAKKTYPVPRRYVICAPLNCGADLHDLLANPDAFKTRFVDDWRAARTGLRGKPLDKTTALAVEAFDFRRIEEWLLRDMLDLHATDEAEHFRLFHITPARGDDPCVPDRPHTVEQVYVAQLVAMYSEREGSPLTVEQVLASPQYAEHFEACRSEFYCAEGLKRFSRDLMPDEFDGLLKMIYEGVRSAVSHPKHIDGFARLDAAVERVGGLSLADSKLHARMRGGDRPGVCHHLANDGRLKWIK